MPKGNEAHYLTKTSSRNMRYAPQMAAAGTNLYAWCANNPVNMVDPTGQSYVWVDQGSYCYEVSYCEWVDQGSYCDLDGYYYPVGYWNSVYYWEMVYVGYYAWVEDGQNSCYEGTWSGGGQAAAQPVPVTVNEYTASVNINDPGYPTFSSNGTHGNYNVETITFEDYAIDRGLLFGEHDLNCDWYLDYYPEGKYNTYVNETWTDKGQLLENLAVTGFAPSPGLIKKVPWIGFAWTFATAPRLHDTRTLKEYCGSGHRAHF